MSTQKYRTKQEHKKRFNTKGKGYIIALDAGYSSMKVFYEDGYFCFPSFTKKIKNQMIPFPNEKDIVYTDLETKESYMVGQNAESMINSVDTNDTDAELYGRKRYSNKNFLILCQTALGIALMEKKDNKEIIVQTGLPASYMTGDTKLIKKVLMKPAYFSLKVGSKPEKVFKFELKDGNISVMPQPAGSLYSILIKNDGTFIPDAHQYLYSNIMIMDIGFGTFDLYGLEDRNVVYQESINDLGMRAVLEKTVSDINNTFDEDLRVNSFQRDLEDGEIECIDGDTMQSEIHNIEPFLQKSSEEVFNNACDKLKTITNSLQGYNYLVISGGTGSAWKDKFTELFKDRKRLTIILANKHDNIPLMYSNVRGYYLFQYNQNKR